MSGSQVIESTAATIHADLNISSGQQADVLRAGEVAALVAVPDDGRRRGGAKKWELGA